MKVKRLIVVLLLLVILFSACAPDGYVNSTVDSSHSVTTLNDDSVNITAYSLNGSYFYILEDFKYGVTCYGTPSSSLFCIRTGQ